MAINHLFSGTWLIEVLSKEAAFSQRFIIEGSAASDGIYAGEVTTIPIVVTGPRWFLRFEWNNNLDSGWQASDIKRTGAEFTRSGGLVTILGADDNVPEARDGDYDDLVLRCRNLDPDLNPGVPPGDVPDFTTPDGARGNSQPCVCPGDPVCPPGHGGLGKGGPGFTGFGPDCDPGGHGLGNLGCGCGSAGRIP